MVEAFHSALSNAQSRGESHLSVELRAEASFFTASVLGMFVMLRANAPQTAVEDAARITLEHLEALRAEPSV